jgi:hypothetical protein
LRSPIERERGWIFLPGIKGLMKSG